MIEWNPPDPALQRLLPPVTPQAGVAYIPSQFVLPFVHGGKGFLFHTLTKQLVEGTLPDRCQGGEGFGGLIAARFLVPEGKDEAAFYQSLSAMMRAFARKKGIGTYTILPTLGCNARCVYCYEEGMQPVSMSQETVAQTVRYIVNTHGEGAVHLNWFGGEPLLRPDVIDRVCRELRDAGLSYRSSMISNGSLITPEVIEKMTGPWQLNRIQISMDGAEADYMARKRYVREDGQYGRVMAAVDAMSQAGIQVSIRCNVDEDNWATVPQFLEDLKTGIAAKDRVTAYFAPLFWARSVNEGLSLWEKIIEIRPLVEAAGFCYRLQSGGNMRFRATHCMADGGDVVIAPDGSLFPCEHCPPESRFGDIWHGVTDEAARKAFCRADRVRERCRTCPFLPDCTAFATCPVQDRQCRAVRELMILDALRRRIDRGQEAEETDAADPVC